MNEDTKKLLKDWHRARKTEDFRRLAVGVKEGDGPVEVALRLWLLRNHQGDLGIMHTLIDALINGFDCRPELYKTILLPFIHEVVQHPELSIRASAIDLLMSPRDAFEFPATIRVWLRGALDELDESELEDYEIEDLHLLFERLASDSREAVWIDQVALEDFVDDVEDLLEGQYGTLLEFVMGLRLRASASQVAMERPSLVQTIRHKGEHTAAVLQRFIDLIRRQGFGDASGDVFEGMTYLNAPAASYTQHIRIPRAGGLDLIGPLERILSDQGSAEDLHPEVAESVLLLLQTLRDFKEDLEIIVTDSESAEWQRSFLVQWSKISKKCLSELKDRADSRPRYVKITSLDVPQANELSQVYQAAFAMEAKGFVEHSDISNIGTPRQVAYYLQAARILGLLDKKNWPTSRTKILGSANSDAERKKIVAFFFEDSEVGRAWLEWARESRMSSINPNTAEAFLIACVPSLSENTARRRASTLVQWHQELFG